MYYNNNNNGNDKVIQVNLCYVQHFAFPTILFASDLALRSEMIQWIIAQK